MNGRATVTPPRLVLGERLLRELLAELARRGQGRRESGAFLLTDRDHPPEALPYPVTAVLFYDDLDPNCLTGGITFHANGYTALNARCRQDQLRVVGDIHTHPGQRVQQSHIDATHPMVALDGHVALIAPHYATDATDPNQLGVHLRADGGWASFYGLDTAQVLQIRPEAPARWWRRLMSWLAMHAKPWSEHRRNR